MGATSTSPDDWSDKAKDLSNQATATAQAYGDSIKDAAADATATAHASASDLKDKVETNTKTLRDSATSIASDLKSQANSQMQDAKGVITSIADEARSRISEIIDQQKALGADKLSGLSRAAQNAATDLDQQNPHVARLVRDAAGSVDRIAGDLRSSDLADVIASVSSFARKQPVAFFAGSVLAGFVLARFIKSEPAPRDLATDIDVRS